jgi:hypothetical protein
VNVQKKKILPGHRVSGVSGRVFRDPPAAPGIDNDIA